MKFSFTKTALFVATIGLMAFTSCSDQKESISSPQARLSSSRVIANTSQNWLISKNRLIEVFNESRNNPYTAQDVVITTSGNGSYQLTYNIQNMIGLSYTLLEQDGDLILESSSMLLKHSCAGDPCNSCELDLSMFSPAECNCMEECDNCRCNHTVTTGMPNDDTPTSIDILKRL